jgi:superfamily II DNA/RNA helicase
MDTLRSIKSKVHIIVATPGRLIDYLESDESTISLSKVSYFVIDEADRMLSMGFLEQLQNISERLQPDRQTLLFSATFSGSLRTSAASLVSEAILIRCNSLVLRAGEARSEDADAITAIQDEDAVSNGVVPGEKDSKKRARDSDDEAEGGVLEMDKDGHTRTASSLSVSKTVEQLVHVCAAHKKPRLLLKYILAAREREKSEKQRQAGAMLVFCNKIKTLKFVRDFLTRQSITCDMIHGQLPQSRRESILLTFKSVNEDFLTTGLFDLT